VKPKRNIRQWPSLIKSFYLKEDGGKKTIHLKRLSLSFIGLLIFIVVPVSLTNFFYQEEDTSQIQRSSSQMSSNKDHQVNQSKDTLQNSVGGVTTHSSQSSTTKRPVSVPQVQINYKAKQVLSANFTNGGKVLPTGVNLIGKLITAIDTRASEEIIKVILPYGGKHKGSGGSLPPNTILFGDLTYSGRGNKVLVNFAKGLLPTGEEIKLRAQALSPKSYSVGLVGEVHGNTLGRTGTALGLTMVSGMTEALVQKEALGQGFNVTPKASLQNGFFNGLSQVANMEATRKAQEMSNTQKYVTIDAGRGLIVSLTGSYKSKE
jgi:hypothetical protein